MHLHFCRRMNNKTNLTVERRDNSWAIFDTHSRCFPEVTVDALTLACVYQDQNKLIGRVLAIHGLRESDYRRMSKDQLRTIGVGVSAISSGVGRPKFGVLSLHQDGSITTA